MPKPSRRASQKLVSVALVVLGITALVQPASAQTWTLSSTDSIYLQSPPLSQKVVASSPNRVGLLVVDQRSEFQAQHAR
ncbi:MAG TPA: hypothetical protein VN201_03500 [Roseateles sp.]|nr:hypothetical protein [Roseateles sp.]